MIGFLTVLGYSLYDTVVVFDKVRENTNEAFANGRFIWDVERFLQLPSEVDVERALLPYPWVMRSLNATPRP